MNNTITTYQQSIRKTFSFQKSTTQLDELMVKAIPLKNGEGFLMAISELHVNDHHLIEKLVKWRIENSFAYTSQFPVSFVGTAKWVRSHILGVEDKILFLILDKYGHAVGHLGLANGINNEMSIEIDNVVRGEKNSHPGIMSVAMVSLLEWTEEFIHPREIYLRVLSDNERAIKFYHQLGFIDDNRMPLRKTVSSDRVDYLPIKIDDKQPPDKYFLRMIYKPERKINTAEMILTAGPSISAHEAIYALDAVKNGWNNQWNKYIKCFEQEFLNYLGMQYALSTSSCTGALHIALQALGIGPGDEVIVPDITWVATANAVVYVGATPVFADVDPVSWCLDPASFAAAITEKTKAVMPVHLYGHPAPMDKIVEIARKHNLYIVEDAAPAIGAECDGRKVGTYGDFAAFSLQGAKLVVSGEGGILLTNNETLYQRAYAIWDQGRVPGTFWINQNGLKYKMSNVQAAVGLGQIERVNELIEAKRRIFSWYAEGLKGCKQITLNEELPWAKSIYWMSSILLNENTDFSRDQLRLLLKERNIDTRSVFPAISQYPHWPKKQATQPTAFLIGERGINLPSGVRLQKEQVDYICRTLREILEGGA